MDPVQRMDELLRKFLGQAHTMAPLILEYLVTPKAFLELVETVQPRSSFVPLRITSKGYILIRAGLNYNNIGLISPFGGLQRYVGYRRHTDEISFVVNSNELLISCCLNKEISIWNLQTGERYYSHTIQAEGSVLAFTLVDNTIIYSIGTIIYMWDYRTHPSETRAFQSRHAGMIMYLTPIGNSGFASCGRCGVVNVYSMTDAKHVEPLEGHTYCVSGAIFNSNKLLTYGGDNQLIVWRSCGDGKKYTLQTKLVGHTDWIACGLIVQKGTFVISCDSKCIKVWYVVHGVCIYTVPVDNTIRCMNVVDNERYLFVAYRNGTVQRFDIHAMLEM